MNVAGRGFRMYGPPIALRYDCPVIKGRRIAYWIGRTPRQIVTSKGHNQLRNRILCTSIHYGSVLFLMGAVSACGPHAHIPPRPVTPVSIPGAVAGTDARAKLARSLAPTLFVQRDEFFPLERVVAVVHPTRNVVAYHLLWRDDVHGSWIPFTVPTDEEIVWVGFDSTNAPNEVWTFWHGKILHTPWINRGPVTIDVQWGKHGSLPRGVIESDLPGLRKLNAFYAFTYLGIWDMWLGRLTRPGPGCFCHSYRRYREFTEPLSVADRVDVVVVAEDPTPALVAVFGRPYSRKRAWP